MSEPCPICGSTDCVDVSAFLADLVCPKCCSRHVVGVVRERSLELAVVDWVCKTCGRGWSDSCILPEEFKVKSVIWGSFASNKRG